MLRQACPEDAFAIGRLHVASWQATYSGQLSPAFLAQLDPVEWAERWRARIRAAEPSSAILIMHSETEPVGFIHVGPYPGHPEAGEVRAIYVDPARVGQRLGDKLIEAGLAELRQSGFSCAVLWVAAANGRARRFYERNGWEPIGPPVAKEVAGTALLSQRYERVLDGD
jgi:ribosomal protein S18 acetylase RimI-like enzyme